MRVKGVLLDLSGVLYVGDKPLPGAIEALEKLQSSGLPVRYVTNTTRRTESMINADLQNMGFNVESDHVFTVSAATKKYLQQHELRPHLLIHPNLVSEYADIDRSDPNVVVLGDAEDAFCYQNLNQAFRLLMEGASLLAMGNNRYFKLPDGLYLDIGPFVAALEYASGVQAHVLGKPSRDFFLQAVSSLGCQPKETLMVGDDVVSDVQGAIASGLQGVLVKTGKYRQGDEKALDENTPVLDDLSAVVEWILQHT